MNRRTTFALDEETIRRLQKLAILLQTSQAEIVRRGVSRIAEEMEQKKQEKLNLLNRYCKQHGLSEKVADSYLREVYENRKTWRGEE